jgi:hypothetical protein
MMCVAAASAWIGFPLSDPAMLEARKEVFAGLETRLALDSAASNTCMDRIRHQALHIYHPCEPVRMWWDKALMVILLYSLMSIPVAVCLNVAAEPGSWRWIFDLAVDVYFCIDICFTFGVGYINHDGLFVTNRCMIALEYLKMWFWIDVGTSLPIVSLLEVVLTDPSVASFLRMPRMLRIVRILRLFKLLRLMKLAKLMSSWRNAHTDMGTLKRIGKLLAVVFFIAHTCACVWCFADIADVDNDGRLPSNGWMARPENAPPSTCRAAVNVTCGTGAWVYEDDVDKARAYLLALYWSLQTLTSVGYGDVGSDQTTYEVFAALFSIYVGTIAFGWIIGNVTAIVMEEDRVTFTVQQKIAELSSYMQQRQLSRPLRKRIAQFYDTVCWSCLLSRNL